VKAIQVVIFLLVLDKNIFKDIFLEKIFVAEILSILIPSLAGTVTASVGIYILARTEVKKRNTFSINSQLPFFIAIKCNRITGLDIHSHKKKSRIQS
jgi:hypothetical protein